MYRFKPGLLGLVRFVTDPELKEVICDSSNVTAIPLVCLPMKPVNCSHCNLRIPPLPWILRGYTPDKQRLCFLMFSLRLRFVLINERVHRNELHNSRSWIPVYWYSSHTCMHAYWMCRLSCVGLELVLIVPWKLTIRWTIFQNDSVHLSPYIHANTVPPFVNWN